MTVQRSPSGKAPDLYCPKCERHTYCIEKIHCWICPLCRHVLAYKEEKEIDTYEI